MRRGTGLLLAAVLAAAPAAADESDFTLASIGIKGQAVFKNYTHFETTPNDDHLVIDEGILQVEWARRLGAWGTVRVVGEFRDDDFGYARGLNFQIPDTGQRRSYLDLKEATISGREGPLEITLGKQIYAWGTADAFNPTDNINPYDYLDVLDNEKLGVWSASAIASRTRSSTVPVSRSRRVRIVVSAASAAFSPAACPPMPSTTTNRPRTGS